MMMQVKNMTIEFEPEKDGTRVTFATRPSAFSLVLSVEDLERISKKFADESRHLTRKGI